MRPLRIVNALARVLRVWSLTLLVPLPVALWFEPWDTSLLGLPAVPRAAVHFTAAFLTCVALWAPLRLWTRGLDGDEMLDREAYITVALAWPTAALLGMLPFLYSGLLASPLDAFFEAMSGLTGTGASVLGGPLEDVGRSLLFWRAFTQWVGGLGIVLFFAAFLSGLTHGGLQALPPGEGGQATRLRPKLRETARSLAGFYAAMTAGMAAVLAVVFARHGAGWDVALFEGAAHAFTSFSTGGFSTRTAGVAAFDDPLLEAALALFMVLGGTSFTLLFLLVRRGDRRLLRNPEWRFYVGLLAVAVAVNAALLALRPGAAGAAPLDPLTALRHSLFAVVSLCTGTAYAAADHAAWPQASLLILLILMLFGGMAGSTSSAIKSFRWLILLKMVVREMRRMAHPRAILPVRLGGRVLEEKTLSAVAGFFFVYLAAWTAGTVAIVATDPALGIVEGTWATAASLGNAGGVGPVGPGGYAGILPSSKLVLAALMWLGRLEILPVLLLLDPRSWRN